MRLLGSLCQLPAGLRSTQRFVPPSKPVHPADIEKLQDFFNSTKKLLVMTGAGLSTESGIPDYRSEGVGLYARTDRRPVQHSDYMGSAKNRQRYWARNFVGWPQFSSFQPNESHMVLSQWERAGKIQWLVTQNIDSLHHKAGSSKLTELHGCTYRVVCMSCKALYKRWDLQEVFKQHNPGWTAEVESLEIAPDGDVLLTDEQVEDFKVPGCEKCGGILKPDVVFFGDNVPVPKVDFVYGQVDSCDGLLVLGSSLHVYSGFRFANRAASQGKPIAIVNIGPTRADNLVNIKIDAKCSEVLPQIHVES